MDQAGMVFAPRRVLALLCFLISPAAAQGAGERAAQSYSCAVFASESYSDVGWVAPGLATTQRALGLGFALTLKGLRLGGYGELLSPSRDAPEVSVSQRNFSLFIGYTLLESEDASIWLETGPGGSTVTVQRRGGDAEELINVDVADVAVGYTFILTGAGPRGFGGPTIGFRLGYRRQFEDSHPGVRDLSGGYLHLTLGGVTGWH